MKNHIIFLLILLAFSHFYVDLMLGIWPLYKTMAGIDLTKAGFIVGVGAFLGEGSQLFFGTLSDKGYRKALILFGLVIASANAFLSYTEEMTLFFCCYLVTCIGSACFHPSGASLVNSLLPEKRGLLMGIFGAAGSLGLGLSQLIFFSVHEKFQGATGSLMIPAVILALVLFIFPFPQIQPTKRPPLSLKDVFNLFKKPALRSLYILQVASQSIMWGSIFILPDVLKVFGHPESVSYGLGHLCFMLGGGFMMIPAGYLSDIYSGRSVMIAAGLIGFFAFYFFLFFGSYSAIIALSALFIIGASLGIINPLGVSLGTKLEPESPGAVSAFLMGMVWCLSEGIGPGGLGYLTSFFTDEYAPVKALAILGSFFFIQFAATLSLPKESRFLSVYSNN